MTKAERHRTTLRARLQEGRTLIALGAYDALSARLIERAGFPPTYIGSYATAAARLGMPDVGLVTLTEMAAQAKSVADAVDIPVLADVENGWYNPANIWRTVREFEDAGIAGIHIEDHEQGKHTDLPVILASRDLANRRIVAALEARRDPNFLIIARTDAARTDVEEAVQRMNGFTDLGADLVMPATISPRALGAVRARIKGKVVITETANATVADEEQAGADVVLYYRFALQAACHGVTTALEAFKQIRSADAVPIGRAEIGAFEDFMGYPAFAVRARQHGVS